MKRTPRRAPRQDAESRLWLVLLVTFASLVGACFEDPQPPSYDNPFDPRNGQGLPIPDSLVVYVGNNAVRLLWGLPEGESADEFAVFRQRLDVTEDEQLLTRVRTRSFLDSGVRNGRTYAYRIAAGRDGRFGTRSQTIEARPGAFSIVINDDAPKTRSRTVTITLTATSGDAVRLYADPDSAASAPWRRATATLGWSLEPGDGDKTVYGVLRLLDGSETLPAFDTIVLDTRATIDSVGFEGQSTRRPGELLHFFLDAGEPGGTASIEVSGLFSALALFDDGGHGDRTAGDGVYERDYTIPSGRSVVNATVTGQFADDIGNVAASRIADRPISVVVSPTPVTLVKPALLAVPPAAAAVTVRWTQAEATEFSAYQVFRSETAGVDSSSRQIRSEPTRNTLQYTDTDVVEGRQYYYRVYVLATTGMQSGSDTVCVLVDNVRPPNPVTLDPAGSVGTARLSLRWSRATERDFRAYRVYRNETGVVGESDSLLAEITAVDRTFWDELGLQDDTTYYYRVFVEDTALLTSRSNEIEATTENEPPADVTLFEATDVTSIAATLSWEASTDRSFALYRLYRAETRPVSTASTLVVELDDIADTSYRDTVIDPGMIYYYRLFVVDQDEAVSEGSNTITVQTTD